MRRQDHTNACSQSPALHTGHAEVVRVLLDRGVDRERKVSLDKVEWIALSSQNHRVQDADGNSALELARLSENDGIIALLEHR